MISIIDYGMGNLRSVQKALETVGIEAEVTDDPGQVIKASGVVLPGVGAFEDAIVNLRKKGMDNAIRDVVQGGTPFLGICLGMQLLFSESEENGIHRGLDLIPGRVIRFSDDEKVPHMGWNQLEQVRPSAIYSNIPDQTYFYFVHSYYCLPEGDETIGTSSYGVSFPAAIQKGNLLGVQFHPEKSSTMGLRLLKNFAGLILERGAG